MSEPPKSLKTAVQRLRMRGIRWSHPGSRPESPEGSRDSSLHAQPFCPQPLCTNCKSNEGKRGDSGLPEPSLMGLRSLPLIPLQAARGVSMGRANLPWCVYRMDEPRSSDETGKHLLSLPLTQTLPLNHRLGLKTRGLCKHIACFQFEATIPSSLLKGCRFFSM